MAATRVDDAHVPTRPPLDRYALLAGSNDIVIDVGPDRLIRWVSPSVADVLGWEPDDLVGRPGSELLHPDDLARIVAARRVVRDGRVTVDEIRYQHHDGSWRWMSGTSQDLHDEAGTLTGTVVGLRDIHAQVEARLAVAVSEERFRLLAENAGDVVFRADRAATIEWVSPSVEAMLGWTPDEIIGTSTLLLRHPDELHESAAVDRRIAAGATMAFEGRCRRRDGSYGWLSVVVRPVFDAAGAVVGCTGSLRDVTTEHEAVEALRESRERFQRIFDAAPSAMVILEPIRDAGGVLIDQTVIWANRAWRALVGDGDGDPTGLRMLDLAPGIAPYLPVHDAVLRSGTAHREDAVRVGARWFTIDYLPFESGMLAVSRDITDLKSAEERIRVLNDDLERRVHERTEALVAANAELETFNYSISHDLRAPLRAINGFSAMLERHLGQELDEVGRHYLDVIEESTLRMAALTEELLGYSRLGRHAVRMEPLDWPRLLSTLRDTVDDRITATGAVLTIRGPMADALGDTMLVERILVNLVENALIYHAPDVPAHVTLSATRTAHGVEVAVEDRGIGIPAQHQGTVFDAFVRLHGEDTYPGTGIGLAVVRRAARLMGSDVSLSSTPGVGSRFWFVLPVEKA